jgi:hypothetical protein
MIHVLYQMHRLPPNTSNNTQKVMLDEDSFFFFSFHINDPLLKPLQKPIEYECLMSSLANTDVRSIHTLIVVLPIYVL